MNLLYYNPIKCTDARIISVDMVVIDYKLTSPSALNEFGRFLDKLPIRCAVEVAQWHSGKIGRFKENHTITFQNGNSFWLGVALNGARADWLRVRLEANPNKVMNHASFLETLAFLNQNSRALNTVVRRFDLAVDIPVPREDVILQKDRRQYSEIRHGSAWTQYLGAKSSTVGRVKLYNKQAEAHLSSPLTRLEMTLDPAETYEKIAWPRVYYITTRQVGLEEALGGITDTERFVLNALLQGCGTVNQLGRKERAKMERILAHYTKEITISKDEYEKSIAHTQNLLQFEKSGITAAHREADQAPASLPRWVELAEAQAPDFSLENVEAQRSDGDPIQIASADATAEKEN